jgi:hypothetical protein
VQVALSPADMITPDMLRDLPEHLERLFTSLGPRAALVLLQDLGPTTDDDLLTPVPLGQGVLPAKLVRDLIRQHVPAETPLVLQPQDLAAQTAWLQG